MFSTLLKVTVHTVLIFAFFIPSACSESVHTKKINPDTIKVLKKELIMTEALEIIKSKVDIESVKAYFAENSERYGFIASKKQDVMMVEGYSISDLSSPIIGYSLFFHEASSSLAMIDASLNPLNSKAMEAAKELTKKAYDSISAGGNSKLFFLGIYDLYKDQKLKIMIREGMSSTGADYAIRYVISSK